MEIAFFWIALSILVAVIANSRGRNVVGWLALSLILSPVIGLIGVLALPSQAGASAPAAPNRFIDPPRPLKPYHGPSYDDEAPTRMCPACAEIVHAASTVCSRCNAPLKPKGAAEPWK